MNSEMAKAFLHFFTLFAGLPVVMQSVMGWTPTSCPKLILIEGVGRWYYAQVLANYLSVYFGVPAVRAGGWFHDDAQALTYCPGGGVLLVANPVFPDRRAVADFLNQLSAFRDVCIIAHVEKLPKRPLSMMGTRFAAMKDFRRMAHSLVIPPLNEWVDLTPLIESAWARGGHKGHIDSKAMAALLNYEWPGDLQEFEDTLRAIRIRKTASNSSSDLLLKDLPECVRALYRPDQAWLTTQVEACHARIIRRALRSTKGQVAQAAHELGIPERTLRRQMRQFGIGKERFRPKASK